MFLWVSLVVDSLVQVICDGDGTSDKQKRLDMVPAGMRNLYDVVLKSISPPPSSN